MRTIELKLFTYDELTGDAKEKARNWFIEHFQNNLPFMSDIYNSIHEVERAFNINLHIDLTGSYWVQEESNYIINYQPSKMDFKRAIAFVNNSVDFKNLPYRLRSKRLFWSIAKNKYEDMMLTGFDFDYFLIRAYERFIKYGRLRGAKNTTLEDFFDILTITAQKYLQAEYDLIEDEDYIKETCYINNYEFTEDGEIYYNVL